MLKKLLLLFFMYTSFCFAQTGGEAAFLILNTNSSARQTALGGKVLTFLDNVNQPTFNPAAINANLDRRLAVNYTSFVGGINIGSASYAHRFDRRGNTFHANISYINYGSFIEADVNGVETGTFNGSDLVFSVGYAMEVYTDLYAGANIKYINATLAGYTSSGIAVDLGLIYYRFDKPYVFTVVARNIGTHLSTFTATGLASDTTFPLDIAIGGSYRLQNVPIRWYATVDSLQKWNITVPNPSNATTDLDGTVTSEEISFFDNAFRHITVGAELFPESAINLRVGYNFRRGKELQLQNLRTFAGVSLGFGLQLKKFKINYAYSKFHSASNSHTFSLEIDLNREPKGKVPIKY